MTQAEIAEKCNISPIAYHNYENDIRKPTIDTLIKLADYYDVSLDYLCGRQYNNQVGYIPDNRKELVKEIIELSDADAKEVQIFLKGYKAGKSGTSEFSIFN